MHTNIFLAQICLQLRNLLNKAGIKTSLWEPTIYRDCKYRSQFNLTAQCVIVENPSPNRIWLFFPNKKNLLFIALSDISVSAHEKDKTLPCDLDWLTLKAHNEFRSQITFWGDFHIQQQGSPLPSPEFPLCYCLHMHIEKCDGVEHYIQHPPFRRLSPR